MPDDVIQISRSELDAIFKNPRLVRVIERLIRRTQDVLPDQIVTLTIAVEEASSSAQTAASSANSAEAVAVAAFNSLTALESAPVHTPHMVPTEDQPARLEALEAMVAQLSNDIEALKQGTTP
jgi:hypothetical protein